MEALGDGLPDAASAAGDYHCFLGKHVLTTLNHLAAKACPEHSRRNAKIHGKIFHRSAAKVAKVREVLLTFPAAKGTKIHENLSAVLVSLHILVTAYESSPFQLTLAAKIDQQANFQPCRL